MILSRTTAGALTGSSRFHPQQKSSQSTEPNGPPHGADLETHCGQTGRIAREAQERARYVFDYDVVLERDGSTGSIKSRVDLYGIDEQAAQTREYSSRRTSQCFHAPCCGPDSART